MILFCDKNSNYSSKCKIFISEKKITDMQKNVIPAYAGIYLLFLIAESYYADS
jgi:hypothetical protein